MSHQENKTFAPEQIRCTESRITSDAAYLESGGAEAVIQKKREVPRDGLLGKFGAKKIVQNAPVLHPDKPTKEGAVSMMDDAEREYKERFPQQELREMLLRKSEVIIPGEEFEKVLEYRKQKLLRPYQDSNQRMKKLKEGDEIVKKNEGGGTLANNRIIELIEERFQGEVLPNDVGNNKVVVEFLNQELVEIGDAEIVVTKERFPDQDLLDSLEMEVDERQKYLAKPIKSKVVINFIGKDEEELPTLKRLVIDWKEIKDLKTSITERQQDDVKYNKDRYEAKGINLREAEKQMVKAVNLPVNMIEEKLKELDFGHVSRIEKRENLLHKSDISGAERLLASKKGMEAEERKKKFPF
jgi:hypothetical protein